MKMLNELLSAAGIRMVQISDLPAGISGTPVSLSAPAPAPSERRVIITKRLLAKPVPRLDIVNINKAIIDIRIPLIRLQDPDATRRRIHGRLPGNQDQNALPADRDVDHGAVHPRPDVRRDRDVRERRRAVIGIRVELQHPLQNCLRSQYFVNRTG